MTLLRTPLGPACLTLWLLATPIAANEVCDPGAAGEGPAAPGGPPGAVSLMILEDGEKVHGLAKALARGVPMAARGPQTVVFRDGRVITADVESAGRVLNALGWSARPIRVVATFGKPRARPRRARG
jgi:hypothetical protein